MLVHQLNGVRHTIEHQMGGSKIEQERNGLEQDRSGLKPVHMAGRHAQLYKPKRMSDLHTQSEMKVNIWCMHRVACKCAVLHDLRARTAQAAWDTHV